MDEPDRTPERASGRAEVRPIPAAGGQRRTMLTAAAIVSALLLGLARPWDLVAPTSATSPPGAHASVAAASPPTEEVTGRGSGPLPGEGPEALVWATCGSPSGWRAASIQRWTGRPAPIRSWIAIEPVTAAGPLDPRIPFAPIATDLVTAIGYCAPLDEPGRPPLSARTELWSLDGTDALRLSAVALEPAERNALGGLWGPGPDVEARVGGERAWPAGRYVLEIRSPGDAFHRWLGLEIHDLRARGAASPSPAAGSPGPAPSAAP